MSLLDSLNGTGGLEEVNDKKQNVPWEKGSKFAYMNPTKKFTLEKYPKAFSGLKISEVKGAPILIPRPKLMNKIEEIYNIQVQKLLRSKTLNVLNIPQVTRDYVNDSVNNNPNQAIQSLVDLIYSADKHGDHPETAQYLKFMVGPENSLDVLFYLYVRQNYKIITHESFLNNKVTPRDPTTMEISYSTAVDIIDQGFYFDKKSRSQLKDAVKGAVKPKQKIKYYDFMMICMNAGVGVSDLNLLHFLIMLYQVKGQDTIDEATLTRNLREKIQKKRGAFGMEGVDGKGVFGEDDMEIDGDEDGGRKSVDGLFDDDDDDEEEGGKGGKKSVDGLFDDDDEDEDDEEELKGAGNNDVLGGLDDSFYLEDEKLLNKYRNKIKPEDNDLQKHIRTLSSRIIQEFINNFIEQNNLDESASHKKQQIFNKIYNKIYNLNMVIFYEDRKLFLDLLRVNKKHKGAAALWDEQSRQYLYMVDLDEPNDELIEEFINTWLNDELVHDNSIFYMEYEYNVPNPVIEEALKVNAEVVVNQKVKK